MKIDITLLNSLSAQAKASPRLRQAYDLRTPSTGSGQAQSEDNSQRILNAMEPGTILPIHRHRGSTETVVVLRGKIKQNFYDENGQLTESFVAGFPFSYEAGVNLPKAILSWLRGEDVDPSMLVPQYGRMFSKNDYLMEIK